MPGLRRRHCSGNASTTQENAHKPPAAATAKTPKCGLEITADTCALARPVAVAERHGRADRRRRDSSAFASCRAGGLWPERGKARVVCSGAAGRLGCLMGVQLGFMGVQLGGKVIWAGSRGLRLRCGNFRAAAGGCHLACQMMERRGADAAVRSWPAAPFRLTAVVVSAGQALGLVRRSGGAAAVRLRNAGPDGPCRVSLDW